MLDEQEGCDPNSSQPDIVSATEAGRLMHMVNYERSHTNRILDQIDTSVDSTIGQSLLKCCGFCFVLWK